MYRKILAGLTNQIFPIRAKDASSTTGAGLAGLAFNTAGLLARYRRQGQSTWQNITLATVPTPGTYTAEGFVAASNSPPGSYEFHPPNASIAAGAEWVEFEIWGAANLVPISILVELDAVNYQNAASFGLTNLDAAFSTRPTLAQIETSTVLAKEATVATRSSQSSVDTKPTLAQIEGSTVLSKEATLANRPTLSQIEGSIILAKEASLTSANSALNTLTTRLTASRAGYLDNLNTGGAVASQADIIALNQSASRRVILQTIQNFERPESGSTLFTVELRTFDGDGTPTNADSLPTLTATGNVSGNLSAGIGGITSPSTGVYRWEYTVQSAATMEQIRFDSSSTIGGTAFNMSVFSQVVDYSKVAWTSTDATKLSAIYDKLPSKSYITGTNNTDGDVQMSEATGNFPGTVGGTAGSVQTLDALQNNILTPLSQKPTLAQVEASTVLAKQATVAVLPTLSQIEASSVLAKESTVGELPTLLEIEGSGALAKQAVLTKLNGMIEAATGYDRWKANALEQAPAGGGGGGGFEEEDRDILEKLDSMIEQYGLYQRLKATALSAIPAVSTTSNSISPEEPLGGSMPVEDYKARIFQGSTFKRTYQILEGTSPMDLVSLVASMRMKFRAPGGIPVFSLTSTPVNGSSIDFSSGGGLIVVTISENDTTTKFPRTSTKLDFDLEFVMQNNEVIKAVFGTALFNRETTY